MTLSDIETLLRKPLKEIFGDDIDKQERHLKTLCHPDQHADDFERADRLFKKISELADQARAPAVVIKGRKRQYAMRELLWTGDAADLYAATAEDKDYILKVSRFPGAEAVLDTEQQNLTAIIKHTEGTHYSQYLPRFEESIEIRDTIKKRINVFIREPGYYALTDVLAKHSKLDGRHFAWIFKRLLTVLGATKRAGYVHGAIVPRHIILHPETHTLKLIGWGQSVQYGTPLKMALNDSKSLYPPEVVAKNPATGATDIYMAAKVAEAITGGIFPAAFTGLIAACQLEGQRMRPSDAWSVLDDLDNLLRRVYGPPKFHVLSMA